MEDSFFQWFFIAYKTFNKVKNLRVYWSFIIIHFSFNCFYALFIYPPLDILGISITISKWLFFQDLHPIILSLLINILKIIDAYMHESWLIPGQITMAVLPEDSEVRENFLNKWLYQNYLALFLQFISITYYNDLWEPLVQVAKAWLPNHEVVILIF